MTHQHRDLAQTANNSFDRPAVARRKETTMSKHTSKVRNRIYWFSVMALCAAGNVWAEDDIVPFDSPIVKFFDALRDAWYFVSGLFS